ncbi:DUF262 domain-containing protein [Vibrio algivorus]|uniref:DUF262 domain-containing protein n=1 Tax=Vibrio algivorus TaxID=1667024 RepID=A0A557NSB0_9VIBR|nr:DUF262 domain-containing protein [Vibrio algivorus]TVO31302.1 DUF262 domain-containing protein [Vibrio algivorus]
MTALKDNLDQLQSKAKERTVKTQTIEYDLETIVKKISRKIIKLNPEYQRKHRWSNEASSKLIESLVLNIPVPFIYISQDVDVDEETDDDVSRYSVIDGQQRLTAIYNFFNNDYPLTDLEVLSPLNGCLYKDLPPFLIRRLEERTVRCLRIDSTIDQQVKYDIFERLNSGSVKLEPQELRNATCRGPFKQLTKRLSKDPIFVANANLAPSSKRVVKMEDEELVLRYFAVTYKDGYKEYRGGFKRFLTDKMVEFNKLSKDELKGFEIEFKGVMELLSKQVNELPFAKYRDSNGKLSRMSKYNVSVFDAMICLGKKAYTSSAKIPKNAAINLFKNKEFFTACEGSVNDVSKLTKRIAIATDLV